MERMEVILRSSFVGFYNFGEDLRTSSIQLYKCPIGKRGKIILIQVTNISGAAVYSVTVNWIDSSRNNKQLKLANICPVPVNRAINLIKGILILEEGDSITAYANVPNVLSISGSVHEF